MTEIITIEDIRKAGYCASGTRRWFEYYELDFRHFLKHGIPAGDLLATGDAMAQKVIDRKRH